MNKQQKVSEGIFVHYTSEDSCKGNELRPKVEQENLAKSVKPENSSEHLIQAPASASTIAQRQDVMCQIFALVSDVFCDIKGISARHRSICSVYTRRNWCIASASCVSRFGSVDGYVSRKISHIRSRNTCNHTELTHVPTTTGTTWLALLHTDVKPYRF